MPTDQRLTVATGAARFVNPQPAAPAGKQPLAMIAIDAEEDFDWLQPLAGTSHSTGCMHHLGDLQSILGAYGTGPTYLLTYPVLRDPDAVRSLRRYHERGACTLGLQLHTWVTPPLEGRDSIAASYAGNLAPRLEEAKLLALSDEFARCFGTRPVVFRSGRYGLSAVTAALLEKHGFTVDASIAPRTSFKDDGGPDFSGFEFAPFWFGAERRLLEVPLCRSVVGWAGEVGRAAYRRLAQPRLPSAWLSLLTRSRAAERITLSPEGNSLADMRRLVRGLRQRGGALLPLSFHSSSLAIGQNPYVRSKADLHAFYDRLSGAMAYLADEVGCRFVALEEVPSLMRPPGPTVAAST